MKFRGLYQLQFRVVRIDNGRNNPNTGIVSEYCTRKEAEDFVTGANQTLRRQTGRANLWHPYAIQQLIDGAWRMI